MADILIVNAKTGVVIERDFTVEELEQRKIDKETVERIEEEYMLKQEEELKIRISAINHAKSLGFTDEMIKVMYPGLIVEDATEE